jgi:hypothetical protein
MRKTSRSMLISLMVVATSLVAVAAALAEGPTSVNQTGGLHFVGTPSVTATKTSTEAYLTATGEVAGAGRTASAVLSATANVTTGCINRGRKAQQPSGLQTTSTTTTGSQTFHTRSGRGRFGFSTTPVGVGSRTCPDKMRPVLVSVTFTNITLTITSNSGTLTATFADLDP